MKHFRSQLVDKVTNAAISATGGKCYVAVNGSPRKATLFTEAGAALANPIDLNSGLADFYVADSVNKVDLYIQSPTGHFVVVKNVEPSGPNSIYVDKSEVETVIIVPFAIQDTTAAAETAAGFVIPSGATVLPHPSVDVVTLDSTQTIDVGTLSSASGDADGFIDGVLLTNAGVAKASILFGSVTLGAKLQAFAGTGSTMPVPEQNVTETGRQISYTLNASTDTAQGFAKIPVLLPVASL